VPDEEDRVMGVPRAYAALSLMVVFALIMGAGLSYDAYDHGRDIGEAICLGCLGLDPEAQTFEDFWVEYPPGHRDAFNPGKSNEGKLPDHPNFILDTLQEFDMVILFFWYTGCVPCANQWEDMKANGTVGGEEWDGWMTVHEDRIKLYTLDIIESENNYRNVDGEELLLTYDADGRSPGAPVTTFIIQYDDGSVGWWSHDGRMRDMSQIDDVIEGGLAIAG